ncbi:hypothetical protein L2E82_09207 [Cichorium intybus]|uniref:Uncharacterized protein n=1 Tax=Cichorium intybus TaxID=13427 RepID=A0ACB9G8Y9_CICIN|nr:hypothetical protein L2E82_09207 [Cichorium intybus]
MEGAANYAAFILGQIASAYRFPDQNFELDWPQTLVNLAISIAASVFLAQLFTKLFTMSDRIKDVVLIILFIGIVVASVILFVAFVMKSIDKSGSSLLKMPLNLKVNNIILLFPFGGAGVVHHYGARLIFHEFITDVLKRSGNMIVRIWNYMLANRIASITLVCTCIIDLILMVKKRGVAALLLLLIPPIVKGTWILLVYVLKAMASNRNQLPGE